MNEEEKQARLLELVSMHTLRTTQVLVTAWNELGPEGTLIYIERIAPMIDALSQALGFVRKMKEMQKEVLH